LADALTARLRELGGEIETSRPVTSLSDLPRSNVVVCDVTPRQLLALSGHALPPRYRRRLDRWRYGPGVFKVDYALDDPIPWRAPEVGRAGTVHLGATAAEIIDSERACWEGRYAERPFVLVAQQSLFDATRAPAGKHTVWAYCHVPHGSTVDMRDRIDAQIERFAPGFRDRILAARTHGPTDLERSNANLVGGDISAGASHLTRLVRPLRYATPVPWLYLSSAATVPGPGVHGMCGHNPARAALRRPAGPPFPGGAPPRPRRGGGGGAVARRSEDMTAKTSAKRLLRLAVAFDVGAAAFAGAASGRAESVTFSAGPSRVVQGNPATFSVSVSPAGARCSLSVRYRSGARQKGLKTLT